MDSGRAAGLGPVVALGRPCSPQACPLDGLAGRLVAASTPAEALKAIHHERPELVVVYDGVNRAEALGFLETVQKTVPDRPVVVVTSRPTVNEAVEFVRRGAADYLAHPLDGAGLERVLAAVRGTSRRSDPGRFFATGCPADVPIVGTSPAIRRAVNLLRLVAESQCDPALIIGETGTGKELAARAIHALRGGTSETFIAVNCAALTANLLESELFGHVKGAFTGADHDKTGLFELAENGSLFLDEVSEMPLDLQAKLLRVLQEREFRKVGGTRTIPCRATVIASSNRNLEAEVRAGRFRRDMYYRLSVFPVELPPLRDPERREDIPLLAEYFIETSALPRGRRVRGLSDEARRRLLAHDWPGNVRELRNAIERALILETTDRVAPESLGLPAAGGPSGTRADIALPENDFSLETAERLFITRALRETDWQRTRAAALLGITRATLHAKLKRYKIKMPDAAAGSQGPDGPPCRTSRLQEARV